MKIHYALFLAHPASNPPFTVELGLEDWQTISLENCLHIPDAVDRIGTFLSEKQATLHAQFTLL